MIFNIDSYNKILKHVRAKMIVALVNELSPFTDRIHVFIATGSILLEDGTSLSMGHLDVPPGYDSNGYFIFNATAGAHSGLAEAEGIIFTESRFNRVARPVEFAAGRVIKIVGYLGDEMVYSEDIECFAETQNIAVQEKAPTKTKPTLSLVK